MGGTVEGTTKVGTWIEFKRELARLGLLTYEDQKAQGMFLEFPTSKRAAYAMMVRNEDDTAWVLEYHFHS
jgi:hypothetical protein